MDTLKITREAVGDLIYATQGTFFTVAFIKRTTGDERVMRATLNYASELVGGEAKYDARENNLVVVRDLDATREGKPAIRSINLDAVLWVKAKGKRYDVISDKEEHDAYLERGTCKNDACEHCN